MKKLLPSVMLSLLSVITVKAQTTLVNYDFNSASSYPVSPTANASGISCSATSSESFQTYAGVATSSVAFTQNTAAGNALAMSNSGGTNTRYFTFQLGGSSLINYQSYKLYLQSQRSTTGATLITVAYSTNGSSYTNLSTTFPVATSFTDIMVDLSSVTVLNNASSVYIKLMASGASSVTGTMRIDNFQVQATQGTGGSGSNPWTISGSNVNFTGNVGIGNSSPTFPLDVAGAARVGSNLQIGGATLLTGDVTASNKLNVGGDATFSGNLYTNSINLGTLVNSTQITSVSRGAARLIYFGAISEQSSAITCIPDYVGGGNIFPTRMTIPPTGSPNINNQLDFRNDGLSSYIEYGHNSAGSPPGPQNRQGNPIVNTTWPTLKINSLCNGNVEIGYGGGTLSAGKFFEVGFPDRNFNVASNIFANGLRTGQRVTTVHPTTPVANTTLYNTQLFVNTAFTHALSVFNTSANATGDEMFMVYGDGKTQINATDKAANYFTIKDISTPATSVDGFAITGNGQIKMNTPNGTQVSSVIDVHDITNNKDLFRVNSDGHVYAREVEIRATNLAFPDYVFAKEYKRLSLPELETFITKNKHLPGFEKAEYYEYNGIKTTDMFVKQQETIENLTLYIIELEKRLNALEESSKH